MHRLANRLLLLAALFSPFVAAAQSFSNDEIAALCEAMIARDGSSIRANESLITYRYSRSSEDLTQSVRALRPIKQQVGGTTSYKSDYSLQLYPVFSPTPIEGKYCYRIRADLELAKSPIEVSIASEYNDPNFRCSHETILEHEMKHVRVYQSFMRYFAQEFKRRFGEELDRVRLTPQQEGVVAEVNRTLLPFMRQYIEASLRRITEINIEVDSPEEYERVRTACLRPTVTPAR